MHPRPWSTMPKEELSPTQVLAILRRVVHDVQILGLAKGEYEDDRGRKDLLGYAKEALGYPADAKEIGHLADLLYVVFRSCGFRSLGNVASFSDKATGPSVIRRLSAGIEKLAREVS